MGHWNHRVVKKVFESGEEQYSVREVFYNDDGQIYAYTEDPIDLACETPEALREYIQWCLNCLDKPILEDGKVIFAKDDFDETEEPYETMDEIIEELKNEYDIKD